MEEAVSKLFFNLVQSYGVGGGVVIMASVFALSFTFMKIAKWGMDKVYITFQRKMHPGTELLKHDCFIKLDHVIKHRLNNINVKCIIRKKLYQDIMRERVTCILDEFRQLVREDIFSWNNSSLYYRIEAALDDSNEKAKSQLLASNVPEFILDAMNEKIMYSWSFHKKYIKHLCYNHALYHTNFDRLTVILDFLAVMVEEYMNTLESTLGEFNGDIKDLDYKGVKCAGCSICIHDEYLNECKQELIDENILPDDGK